MIPQFDLKRQYELIKNEIDTELRSVLNSGKFILGENVQEIEEMISSYLGINYAISCNSGTDAIFLALKSINISNGDEIITTPFTFISTVEAIINSGAKPVFVDIDEDSFNIDTRKIEEKISDKTKAILPVHLFGNPVNIKEIKELTQNKDIKIIEDCAQSFGAKYNEDNVGTVGDIGCFSFYPTKNLGCYGDGGLITTNSKDIYSKLISLRNHGSFDKYNHDSIGINSRLDEIQAAILKVKMNYINEYNNKRISNAELYSKLLNKNSLVRIPNSSNNAKHVFHQYTIKTEKRDKLIKILEDNKIGHAIYYPIPLNKQKIYKNLYGQSSFPTAEKVSQNCISLPMFPELSIDEIKYISNIINKEV
tara:strand:+ start:2675 stop:3769 length:1095 start_codon:yes stop_codon:yes gene_type:complete